MKGRNSQSRNNYLKHYGIIRRYVQVKYDITVSDLEVMLFMNSEPAFALYQLRDINSITGMSVSRMKRLHKLGFVDFLEDESVARVKHIKRISRLYALSSKGKAVVNLLYEKLDGGHISVCANNNPIFKKSAPLNHQRQAKDLMRLYRKQMRGMR